MKSREKSEFVKIFEEMVSCALFQFHRLCLFLQTLCKVNERVNVQNGEEKVLSLRFSKIMYKKEISTANCMTRKFVFNAVFFIHSPNRLSERGAKYSLYRTQPSKNTKKKK